MATPGYILKSIDAEVLDVCFFEGPTQHALSRIPCVPAGELIIVSDGVYKGIVDTPSGREYICATAGDVVCWPANVEHTDESEAEKPLRCIVVWFCWPSMPAGLPFRIRDEERLINQLAGRLLTISHDPHRQTVLGAEADAFLHGILSEFILHARRMSNDLRSLVIRYIEDNIQSPVRLDDLARITGLEKHYLVRKYRQVTGLTPMQEVRQRKAARAKHLLQLNPSLSLASVARLVGVAHTSTLCRMLIHDAGTTARDIRRSARATSGQKRHRITAF